MRNAALLMSIVGLLAVGCINDPTTSEATGTETAVDTQSATDESVDTATETVVDSSTDTATAE